MSDDSFRSGTYESLAELCILLGAHYDTAPEAVDALKILAGGNKSVYDRAVCNWVHIVNQSSDAPESMIIPTAETETPSKRQRVGAMRALATLCRESPSPAPVETFVAGITDSHPLVRLYASYGLAASASRDPELIHPHLDVMIENIGNNLNPLGGSDWPNPDFDTPADVVDEIFNAKLMRAAFTSTLLGNDSDAFQQVVVGVNRRLDGDLIYTADQLVRTLPFDPKIWPEYIKLLDRFQEPAENSYVEYAVCYRLESTCEDWRHDGHLPEGFSGDTTADTIALLRRGFETVSDPELTAPLNRAIGDFVLAWANSAVLPDVPWSAVRKEASHRRLTSTNQPFDIDEPVETQLEKTAMSLLSVIEQHPSDLEYLHDHSLLYPLEDITAIAPQIVRSHADPLQAILSTPVKNGAKRDMDVIARSSRIVGYIGERFPEAVQPAAQSAVEFLQDTVENDRVRLLDDALAGAVMSTRNHPELLQPFREQLSDWCIDPPGTDSMDFKISPTRIQYYALFGLYTTPGDKTNETLRQITAENATSHRVNELAEYILESD